MSDTFVLALTTAIWALASALAVIILGAASALGGRSRPRGSFAFAAFCVLWGFEVVAQSTAGIVPSVATSSTLYLSAIAMLFATPYLLLEFASAQFASRKSSGWRVAKLAAVLVAAVGVLVLLTDPALIFQGVRSANGVHFSVRGPLQVPLVWAPHFIAFGIALLAMTSAASRAPTDRTRSRISLLQRGLSLYIGYAATNNLVVYLYQLERGRTSADNLEFAAAFAILTAICALILVRAWNALKTARPADRKQHQWLLFALGLPMAWGALEGVIASVSPDLDSFETVGLWRLAGVAVIAYGLARWRFYDLPQRTTRVAAAASGATAATVGAAAAAGATTLATDQTAVPIAAGLLVLSASILPSVRFARRLFGVTDVRTQKADDQLYGQRIDAYRAALEASLARDSLDEDREFLAALRERFGITDAEERVLLHYARSSVIVARSDKAFDAFERLRLLGEGGGGRTWLARDRARDRLVVLKEPLDKHHADPAVRENVLREARLAARVRHPNVVNVEQVVESKGAPVIVMEYLEGGSLADVLRARGTLPWREAVETTLGVLRGVEAVHAAGIIHRDVKPSNVLIGAEGAPKVADFGVAVPASGGATIVEGNSTFAGTLSYLAPEVRFRGQPADRRSDVYSCAVLLHECLHGAPPGRTAVVVHNDVPAGISAALARGLADDPDARFPTARAFAEELARLLR